MRVYARICMYPINLHVLAYTNCLQVCICMHIYVYNGICMYVTYMHVLCTYMHVFPGQEIPGCRSLELMPRPRNSVSRGGNRRATLSAPYAYVHVYLFRRYIYSRILNNVHCYAGIVVEVTPVYFGDGCSRPENANGVLHHFKHLYARPFQGTDFLEGQALPCLVWQERRN